MNDVLRTFVGIYPILEDDQYLAMGWSLSFHILEQGCIFVDQTNKMSTGKIKLRIKKHTAG